VTRWIEERANRLLSNDLGGVARVPYNEARRPATIQTYDYVGRYVADLASIVDMEVIRDARLKIGADPLGGASVGFWRPIADRFGIDVEALGGGDGMRWRMSILRLRLPPYATRRCSRCS
jgi:phosphoglucomutase